MQTSLQALVVADDLVGRERIRKAFERHSVPCTDVHSGKSGWTNQQTDYDIALVLLESSVEQCARRIQQLKRANVRSVVVAGPTDDTNTVLHLIRAGADDFICSNGTLEKDVSVLVDRVRAAVSQSQHVGEIVAVTSASGGCGVSTIAANLAVALARSRERVALMDFQFFGGDQVGLLNVAPQHHLVELCENIDSLDHEMFKKTFEAHESGVHLLASPPAYQVTEVAESNDLAGISAQLIRFAMACFPLTIIDLANCVHQEQAHLAQEADILLIVTRMEFMSLYRTRALLDHLCASQCDLAKVRIVANRHGQPGEICKRKAADLLGRSIDHFVPDDPRSSNLALNVGNPLVLEFATTKIAKAFASMADSLGVTAPPSPN